MPGSEVTGGARASLCAALLRFVLPPEVQKEATTVSPKGGAQYAVDDGVDGEADEIGVEEHEMHVQLCQRQGMSIVTLTLTLTVTVTSGQMHADYDQPGQVAERKDHRHHEQHLGRPR